MLWKLQLLKEVKDDLIKLKDGPYSVNGQKTIPIS